CTISAALHLPSSGWAVSKSGGKSFSAATTSSYPALYVAISSRRSSVVIISSLGSFRKSEHQRRRVKYRDWQRVVSPLPNGRAQCGNYSSRNEQVKWSRNSLMQLRPETIRPLIKYSSNKRT